MSAWLAPLLFIVALIILCGLIIWRKDELRAKVEMHYAWLAALGTKGTALLIATQICVVLKTNHESGE